MGETSIILDTFGPAVKVADHNRQGPSLEALERRVELAVNHGVQYRVRATEDDLPVDILTAVHTNLHTVAESIVLHMCRNGRAGFDIRMPEDRFVAAVKALTFNMYQSFDLLISNEIENSALVFPKR